MYWLQLWSTRVFSKLNKQKAVVYSLQQSGKLAAGLRMPQPNLTAMG